MTARSSHPKRSHHASRAEKQRRGRLYGLLFLGLPALALAFYAVDRTGTTETLSGTVVKTSTYLHSGRDTQGEHSHVSALLEYEGHRYRLEPGDRFQQGQAVSVEIRRGRITGFPYFVQAWR